MSEPTTLQGGNGWQNWSKNSVSFITELQNNRVNENPVRDSPRQFILTFLIFYFVCCFGVAGISPH